MIKKILKVVGYTLGGLLSVALVLSALVYFQSSRESAANLALLGRVAPVLDTAGFSYRDLNKNGRLDIYEDNRAGIDSRIEDLLSQMNIEEKAGLMFITMAAMNKPIPSTIKSRLRRYALQAFSVRARFTATMQAVRTIKYLRDAALAHPM